MVEISGIKLDKADRKLLAELDKDCRTPATLLAKRILKSRQAVEYRIQRLQEEGVITSFNAVFNPHALGFTIYKTYLKLRNIPEERKKLVAWLKQSGRIYWMGECSGRWDLVFTVAAKSDYAFFELKNALYTQFNDMILEEYGDVILDVEQYPAMYFTGERTTPTSLGGLLAHHELDELDEKILGAIVNDARLTLVEVARKVDATPATVKARIKRLEQLGVIVHYHVGIDLNRLGLDLYKAVLKIDRYTKEDEARLREYCGQLPVAYCLTRNLWQLELEIIVSSYQEYYETIERLKREFAGVIRTVDSMQMITDEWTPGFTHLAERT